MKENNELNKNNRDKKKYQDKSYDERNKYDCIDKYYLHLAIGTKYEDCIEITKEEYYRLNKILKKSKESMIEVFAIYLLGFFQDSETYVLKEVNKDVFYCIADSQRKERNRRRHEKERHLAINAKEDLDDYPSDYNLELNVIENIQREEIKKTLNSILSMKQSERFYKNRIDNIPFVIIAFQEKSSPDAVRNSVNKAEKKIKSNEKYLNKFKKFKNF